MAPVLELRDVRARYGRVEVLRGLDLVVPQGSLVSLIGPNGAGKTTTLRVIAGLLTPTSGEVLLEGRSIVGRRPHQIARAGACLIPEGRGIFPALTVTENLRMQAEGGDGSDETRERALQYFPRLQERLQQTAGTLSGGEQQMLALARALMTNPKVLLLDEISMGLAPLVVAKLFETVEALAADGITVLLIEQFLTYALRLSDLVYVINRGAVTFVGEPDELRVRETADQLVYR
jgi:branched-chain amino acid transport system ATP-binding protein